MDTNAVVSSDPVIIGFKKKIEKFPDNPRKATELLGAIYDAMAKAEKEKTDAESAMEETPQYIAVQAAQTKIAHLDALLRAAKETFVPIMEKNGVRTSTSDKHKVMLKKTSRIEVKDEYKLVTWLKGMKKYSEIYLVLPVLQKTKLNSLVKGLVEERRMPPVAESGISVEENTSVSVGFIE